MSSMDQLIKQREKLSAMEKLGVAYFKRLRKADTKQHVVSTEDAVLKKEVRRVTAIASVFAFLIGAITAWISIYIFVKYDGRGVIVQYGMMTAVTIPAAILEFIVLFDISLRAVYHISKLTGHSRFHEDEDLIASQIPNMLSRAALEIPDPYLSVLGIDPLAKVSKKRLLVMGLLYKVKVILSNYIAKMVLFRVLGKSFMRVSIAYVSVLVTGIWNAVTIFKVARDARLRLFGNVLARYLCDEILTPQILSQLSLPAKQTCLRALGVALLLAQSAHPNMVILLVRITGVLKIDRPENLEDIEIFQKALTKLSSEERSFILDLFCVAVAFDGRITKLERKHFHSVFKEYTELYTKRIHNLQSMLVDGRLTSAKSHCTLDFSPG